MTSSSRQRAAGKRRPVGIVVACISLAVLVAAGVVVWATPVFGARTVDVAGATSAETVTDVLNAADISVGQPLARVDLDAVRERVLSVSVVADATVQRQWPDAVAITVTERVPVATTQANGLWWLVDDTGRPFRSDSRRPADLMPLELATPGPDDRATAAALAVLASLSPQVREQVASVMAATEYGVTLRLADGRSVIWGSDRDAAAKNEVIPAILDQPGQVFDVSDPTLVTVRDD